MRLLLKLFFFEEVMYLYWLFVFRTVLKYINLVALVSKTCCKKRIYFNISSSSVDIRVFVHPRFRGTNVLFHSTFCGPPLPWTRVQGIAARRSSASRKPRTCTLKFVYLIIFVYLLIPRFQDTNIYIRVLTADQLCREPAFIASRLARALRAHVA